MSSVAVVRAQLPGAGLSDHFAQLANRTCKPSETGREVFTFGQPWTRHTTSPSQTESSRKASGSRSSACTRTWGARRRPVLETARSLASGRPRFAVRLTAACRRPSYWICRDADRSASDWEAAGVNDDAPDWTVLHFAQSNPTGEGQGDVAALLRRVAASVDQLGDVQVQDVTFHSEVTGGEDDLTMIVYYHRQPRRR